MNLTWESAQTDEPGDQNADSRFGAHAYWSLGPNGGGRWAVELIVRDCDLTERPLYSIALGDFPDEDDAKHAALAEEDAGKIPTLSCEHNRSGD